MKPIIFLIAAGLCFAQTAEVHDLTADESAEGRKLYAEMKHADEAYTNYQRRMEKKYLRAGTCISLTITGMSCGDGDGEFSAEFRHILPRNTLSLRNIPGSVILSKEQ